MKLVERIRVALAAGRRTDGKRFLRFTFEREAKWLLVLYVLLPLLAILLAIVIPGMLRRWFP